MKLSMLRRESVLIIMLFTLALMAFTSYEQGRTIAAQRALINDLFQDTMELNVLKAELAHYRGAKDPKAAPPTFHPLPR